MNRNLTFCILTAMLLVAARFCAADEVFPVVHNEPISVRVVDGRNGKPQAQVRVVLMGGYDRRDLRLGMWREEAMTDGEGNVYLSNALRNLPLLHVEVVKRHGCAGDAGALSLERIRLGGLSGANRCGAVIAENLPGVFTVFVNGGKVVVEKAANALNPAVAPVELHATVEPNGKKPAPVAQMTDAEVDELLLQQN